MPSSVRTRAIPTAVGALNVETRGSGPAVFCWPSLYCDARTLDPVVEDLARDHCVIVVDGPGHGRSGSSGGRFSLDDCARAAVEVLDAVGVGRVTWIGAAWGGQVGVVAARRDSDRLDSLIILNAPMRPWRGRRLMLMRLTYLLLWLFGPRSFVAGMLADKMIAPNAVPDRQAMVATIADAVRRCDRRGLLLAARSAMFDRGDLVPLLSDVRVPAVFIAGAEDALFPVAEARIQAATIPDCRFVVVQRSSHQSALEVPNEVVTVIRETIARAHARDVRVAQS